VAVHHGTAALTSACSLSAQLWGGSKNPQPLGMSMCVAVLHGWLVLHHNVVWSATCCNHCVGCSTSAWCVECCTTLWCGPQRVAASVWAAWLSVMCGVLHHSMVWSAACCSQCVECSASTWCVECCTTIWCGLQRVAASVWAAWQGVVCG
jgi:hypothetical protein